MAIQIGRDSIIGYTEVSSTAELAGTGPAEQIFVDNFSFKRTREEQLIPELTGTRGVRRRTVGAINATGSFTRSVDTANGIGLYKHLLTGSVTTASQGSGTFVHTFSEGEDMADNARLQWMISQGGASTTTRNWYNGVVESYSLEVSADNIPKENWSLQMADHGAVLNTAPAIALTFENPINYNKVTMSLGVSITAVSVVATRDITLNINNNPEMNREIGTATVNQFTFGNRDITGNFNAVFEDLNLYNLYIDNTAMAMQLDLVSDEVTSTTAHYIRIKLPQVHFNGETPDVEQGQIIQPMQFTAIYGSNAGYQVQIDVLNSQSALSGVN